MLDISRSLARFHAEGGPGTRLAGEFLAGGADVGRYVLGRNQHALNCARRVRIDGVVDDFASSGSVWNDFPVIAADELPEGSIVVNCSMSIRPKSAHARLTSIRGIRVLAYADLVRADKNFPLPDFVASFRTDYAENATEWRWMEAHLTDEESRSVLNALMLYRLTGDYRHMSAFSVRFHEQYFDPIVVLLDSEVFVDCGGFDGDTVLEFCSRMPAYKHIYMFEPSSVNFAKAEARLRDVPRITLLPLGVSNTNGTLWFNPEAGSASAVTPGGSVTIDVVAIDECITEPVTYIKMDLEGWELQALKGARGHIAQDHPKLAISVYHHPADFWRIPGYILAVRDDYDIYLRHYSEGWSETVMYFVPRVSGSSTGLLSHTAIAAGVPG